ncbi:MAG TPA: DUF2339 domain-containing protein [Gaiellaceae bacterium]|nr:DUF2339 domain-containing protein [Gaiellaceae bacterium]
MSGKVVLGGLALALLAAFVHPGLGALVLGALIVALAAGWGRTPAPPRPDDAGRRLRALELRLAAVEQELRALQATLAGAWPAAPAASTFAPSPPRPVEVEPEELVEAEPEPEPADAAPPPAPPGRLGRNWGIEASDLLGARALALAGGVVTLLGIVFFFVLAANRGWINAELRLGFGAAASVGLFAAGLWIRRSYGHLYSAVAAVGTGIAGGFATLLAATALYGFVPEVWALVAAGGVATVAVVTALAWSAELVAGLGLVGAMVVPLMVVLEEDELSFVGTGFVAIVLAATAIVAVERRWRLLLLAGGGVAVAQIAGLVAQTDGLDWSVVALCGMFWLLLLAAGLAYQLRTGVRAIEPLTATFVLAGAALACYAAAWLFSGEAGGIAREGAALLVVALVNGVLGGWLFRSRRDLGALLWATGLTVAAVAGAELLSGPALTVTWAGEAAVLAWLSGVARERRFQLSAFAYLLLALGYTLAVAAPPSDLFEQATGPADGILSVLAVAGAAAALAWFTRGRAERPPSGGRLATLVHDAVDVVRAAPAAYGWLAGLALVYAASLGLLELVLWMRFDDFATRWERGHVAVSALWSALALLLVEAGLRRRGLGLELGGLALLAVAVLKVLLYDAEQLASGRWPVSFLAVAGAALLTGHEYQRLGRWGGLRAEAAVSHVAGLALAVVAIVQLADGRWQAIDLEGAWLLVAAAVCGGFGALSLRTERDLATIQWGSGLLLAGGAAALLVGHLWLVLAWTAAAAVLAWLAGTAGELRFQAFSAAFLAAAGGYALVVDAPPRDFFVAAAHPGDGVPSLAFVVAAALGFALFARHATRPAEPVGWEETLTFARLSEILAAPQARYRLAAVVAAGVLALYGLSLTILEVAQSASAGSVETGFQRGHTAVSAFWGAVGVGLLYVGLTRRSLPLRLAGFGLFGVSLAKLFLYDLAYLSSLARALSFLAVGVLLLAAGFFYQRLSERLDEREAPAP